MTQNEQIEAVAVTQTGSTFAERKAAAEKVTKVEPKQVDKDADEVEDKAIKSAATKTKRPARKS